MLSYYIVFVLLGSADCQTRVCTIELTKCVHVAAVMLVVNAENGACSSYYAQCSLFNHVRCSILFRHQLRVRHAIIYLCLSYLAQGMDTDPFLATMTVHWCSQSDWKKRTVHDAFLSLSYGSNLRIGKGVRASHQRK